MLIIRILCHFFFFVQLGWRLSRVLWGKKDILQMKTKPEIKTLIQNIIQPQITQDISLKLKHTFVV